MPAKKKTTNATAKRAVKRNASGSGQAISTEEGLAAASAIAELADAQKIRYALAGGIAMHLYGFTRATRDVDMIASESLALRAVRRLTFGGETYQVKARKKIIEIDWIVRDDEKKDVYEAALRDSLRSPIRTPAGLPIIKPEWMVILKKLADRGKDHLDLLWLLREEGLVDRRTVQQIVKNIFGRYAYLLLQELESVYLEADLLRARDERTE